MSELSPPPPPLSDAEIRKEIASLTAGERTKLIKIARCHLWIEEPDELVQEALFRVLAGKRKWPRDLEKLKFLRGVIKSIAGDRAREQAKREQAKREQAKKRTEVGRRATEVGRRGLIDYEGPQARGIQAGLDLERIKILFDDDPIAQKILMGVADREDLSQTEYESKWKKIRRRIEKLKT
jgi:DNA-directed RNA polymerase specialized sigma24 family protein